MANLTFIDTMWVNIQGDRNGQSRTAGKCIFMVTRST
jgi:hypothetical protein